MFVRIKSSPNSPKRAVQIVESIRVGDKVKQRIVRHVGTALDDDELARLKELAQYIKAKIENQIQPTLFKPETLAKMSIEAMDLQAQLEKEKEIEKNVLLNDLKEEQRVIVGIHHVYGEIFRQLGFDRVCGDPSRKMAHANALYHTVMTRIALPGSKRQNVDFLERDFGVSLDLNKVYRMMDKLDDKAQDYIRAKAYENAVGIIGEPIKVAFYDCTTLYFESVEDDDLKATGYSKDGKFNQVQVLLALLSTSSGLPIGYEVFDGNTFEGHTLENALDQLEERFSIQQLVFVADSAMLSKDNMELLESRNFPYIVAARLKSLPKHQREQILNPDNYKETSAEGISIASFSQPNDRKLIMTHSTQRAKKDKHDRQKAIDQIKKRLSKNKTVKGIINNYGYKKYLNIDSSSKISINEQKIAEAEKWDGLHGIVTNVKNLTPQEIIQHYHGLWQIEECFRISKHDMRVRPIFHWTPRRIRAHIAICFMSLVCIRTLEYRVALQYKKLSPEKIRNELIHSQVSVLRHQKTNARYGIPSKLTQDLKKIYQVVGKKRTDTPFFISN